jgi:molecular chaperone HtpG
MWMTEPTQQQFQIHLPGLLKVLAESLYSTKKVAIRELLQNAHDSCVRRSVEGSERSYRPRVDVSIDPARRTLTIRDNGSGLSQEEVINYLSTIGRSYTRDLSERLSILAPEEAAKLIGQFGLGFLSAFLIASEVTLTTHSMQPGSSALRWHSTGDVHYDLTQAFRDEIGTTIELLIKPSAAFVLNEDVLVETIRQYADFLPVPIYVSGMSQPVNLMTPPWELPNPQAQALDYVERTFHTQDPLCVIPLSDQEIDLGHDTLHLPLKGFLFVPPSSVASVREYGDLIVFIRRMFICDRQRDLLPPWARFVRGVIDCPSLQPTASREEIQQDEMFVFVQQALKTQLVAGLRHIAQNDPALWKQIVRGHSDVITGWAASDNEFFKQVADIVAFRTSRGLLGLPEYLGLTSGAIYYVTRELGSLQEQLLGEGRGVPVLDASWFGVKPFLEKYADWKQNIQLIQMDGEASQLLRPVAAAPFAKLLDYYHSHGVRARVAAFKPEDVPAVMMYPKDAEFLIEAQHALDAGELPGPLAGFVSDFMRKKNVAEDENKGRLYLNAACPLITRLIESPPAEAALQATLALIYQVARLFAGRTLTTADATMAFREAVQALQELLKYAD